MSEIGEMIGNKGTTAAAFIPVRTEHEVIDYELFTAVEELEHVDFARGAFESVWLVNLDHWELANLSAKCIASTAKFLFLDKKFLTGGEPLSRGCYLSAKKC